MTKIDCEGLKWICSNFDIEKLPTVLWLQQGKIIEKFYGDSSNFVAVKSFFDKNYQRILNSKNETKIIESESIESSNESYYENSSEDSENSEYEESSEISNENQSETSEFVIFPKNSSTSKSKLITKIVKAFSNEKIEEKKSKSFAIVREIPNFRTKIINFGEISTQNR